MSPSSAHYLCENTDASETSVPFLLRPLELGADGGGIVESTSDVDLVVDVTDFVLDGGSIESCGA